MAIPQVYFHRDDFHGNRTYSTTADANGLAIVKVNGSSATATTLDGASRGKCRLLLDNTSQVQSITLYDKDTLSYDIDEMDYAEFRVCLDDEDANTAGFVGMAGAHNATLASIATRAGFVIGAGGALSVCTDDGTVDSTNIATGYTLGATDYLLGIDFSNKSDIKFYIHDGTANRRVAKGTTFSMANATGSMQKYIRNGKADGTAVTKLDIDHFEIKMTAN